MSTGQHTSRPQDFARILLVDDNSYGLSARRTILESLGYSVVAKACPRQALECFSTDVFDLVITDYRMPGMDGTQLISRVKEACPALPAILISGFGEMLGLDHASTGADVIIQKSAHEVSMMVRAIERLLGRGKVPRKPAASYRSSTTSRISAQF